MMNNNVTYFEVLMFFSNVTSLKLQMSVLNWLCFSILYLCAAQKTAGYIGLKMVALSEWKNGNVAGSGSMAISTGLPFWLSCPKISFDPSVMLAPPINNRLRLRNTELICLHAQACRLVPTKNKEVERNPCEHTVVVPSTVIKREPSIFPA